MWKREREREEAKGVVFDVVNIFVRTSAALLLPLCRDMLNHVDAEWERDSGPSRRIQPPAGAPGRASGGTHFAHERSPQTPARAEAAIYYVVFLSKTVTMLPVGLIVGHTASPPAPLSHFPHTTIVAAIVRIDGVSMRGGSFQGLCEPGTGSYPGTAVALWSKQSITLYKD